LNRKRKNEGVGLRRENLFGLLETKRAISQTTTTLMSIKKGKSVLPREKKRVKR